MKQRRILWGFVGELDSQEADVAKGWSTVEGIPRTVLYDVKTGTNVLTWPIEEVESLRKTRKDFAGITVNKGSTVELVNIGDANQLDIEAEFQISEDELKATVGANMDYYCSTSGGAARRGMLGPFGLLVLANRGLTEFTATYFYVIKGTDGTLHSHFCQDETRSSKAKAMAVQKSVVGAKVPVLDGEMFAVRILIYKDNTYTVRIVVSDDTEKLVKEVEELRDKNQEMSVTINQLQEQMSSVQEFIQGMRREQEPQI